MRKNLDLDCQYSDPIQIQHIGDSSQDRPHILDSLYYKINFGALLEQIETIKQIRDFLEIRPSRQSRSLSISMDSVESRQAIEGLTSDERQKVKQLC